MEEERKGKSKKWWIIGGVILIFIIIIAASSGDSETPAGNQTTEPTTTQAEQVDTEPAKDKDAGKMTMEKFNKIESGMTYEEVTEIIGGEGEVMSESGEKGSDYHTVIYQYEGVGSLGANANLTFQGGKLINKAQFGLE